MQASSAVAGLPQRTRIYQNHHFDSTRWDYFERRPDDVVIATSYKAGTTWTQSIVAHLLFPDAALPGPLGEVSPWLDMRVTPLELVLNELKGQTHRRFVKTHLPLDGLPYDERLKYVYVSRDARDVFMSLWNHYSNHSDEAYVVKARGEQYAPAGGALWKGGAQTFLHAGTNGRWRDVLSDQELALYDAACERTLSTECRQWLERGRLYSTGQGV